MMQEGENVNDPILTESVLPGLDNSVFIQAPQARHDLVRDLVVNESMGVVYSLDPGRRRRNRQAETRAIVDYTRHRAPRAPIMVDANLYSGRNRKTGSQGLTAGWTDFQQTVCSLPYALTDSGYIGEHDVAALDTVLAAADKLTGRVVTVLPLHWKWLTEHLDVLKARLEAFGRPVALALENKTDPLGEKGAAAGLCSLIATGVPILLLRSDTSAIGALAYGACGVAVGTESGLRHVYPIVNGSGAPAMTSILVPELLTYYTLDKVGDAIQLNPDLNLWTCRCLHCGGRRLDWIRFHGAAADQAFGHSLSSLSALARSIAATPASLRPEAWTEMCQNAQLAHYQIKKVNEEETWEGKSVLREWSLVTPTRTGA
ncbi:hypothetical protein J7E83_17800 [Arthrobacter sp. ISL-48]|uniref:hypothetical protein n=1 Tax=Arthrobacter sp. ISL-48 TaxID=2819110 RepID=UPI001BEA5B3D|nr:hypothetical protein [Arthrobacter sp. ISL-48]MBT2533945.1 hypothetical protein [Arthrobacter sp. ISL-48]